MPLQAKANGFQISPELSALKRRLICLRVPDYITPLYADIAVNEEWLEVAMANDAELGCLVVQQNDSSQMMLFSLLIPKTVFLMLHP